MDRKAYWNEDYLRYFQARTSDQNAHVVLPGDCIPPDVLLFEQYMQHLNLVPGNKVLEVGIGFGRLVPSFLSREAEVYGIDISSAMIEEAKRLWGTKAIDLRECEAEQLPYSDDFFHAVVCWGVFDACFQNRVLSEMARVLKVGGSLLVTGKNDDYYDDDELAYVAEVNARAKGHPNFFTDFPALRQALPELGLRETAVYYFERRGDLSKNCYLLTPPPHFYEYVVACVKYDRTLHSCQTVLANELSQTFLRKN